MEIQVDASKLAFRLATNLRPLALVFADLCSAIDLKELKIDASSSSFDLTKQACYTLMQVHASCRPKKKHY